MGKTSVSHRKNYYKPTTARFKDARCFDAYRPSAVDENGQRNRLYLEGMPEDDEVGVLARLERADFLLTAENPGASM